MEQKEEKQSFWSWKLSNSEREHFWSWRMSDKELAEQVENYSTLKFSETYRGIAVLFVGGLMVLSLVLAFFGVIALDSSTIIEAAIYAIALFFIYKGHRWAIVTVMILWTGDKLVQLYDASINGHNNFVPIVIWWFIVMPYLYKALRVENERRKLAPAPVRAVAAGGYCAHCGAKIETEAKFCVKCGTAL